MIKKIDLGFTDVEIYEDYFVGRTKKGIHLTLDKHLVVLDVVNQYFSSPYGIVIDEVNSYSVDLPVLLHISKDENIVCVGVVCYREITEVALDLAKDTIEKPSKFSSQKEVVTSWVEEQVALLKN